MSLSAPLSIRSPLSPVIGRLLALLTAIVSLVGCAQTQSFTRSPELDKPSGEIIVLLMPADVELAKVTAGGLTEPHAEWTERGRRNLSEGLKQVLAERDARLMRYRSPENEDLAVAPEDQQLVKLHAAVSGAIFMHKYLGQLALPTKKDSFEWTLGPRAAALGEDYDADYALFVTYRQSFATAGRVAVMAAAAVLGGSAQGGQQAGYASLVDLKTGHIQWFNAMGGGAYDVRESGSAILVAEQLLDELPL